MADTMQFDLVSPERNLVSVPVREVRLPGADGDLTAMPGHAPAIVNLRPGLVTVVAGDGSETEFAVTGGFAEINNESVTLLAERGHPRAEMTQEVFNEMMAQARRRVEAAKERESAGEELVAAAVKLLADMEALGTHIGLDPNHANFPH
ncbi:MULTISPECIES: F0F1 ATP synthase subunit epsilon [Paracoccus]|jgi:F-type H+-transporting ATPase subunit epsilon|uniref:ATP synthase epsilon chain n=1 Tax=Paracoccus denitrificans (strain Pd 1222) TaxID=318586 RepID=ATPE_PARDP|nr:MULTISPECIES: F0F1 ATP synthase subunit epsilon [Paracoccus]A1B8P1.1 RecName: Full=ATP synthase epsilon chain; AltName: Full=ATP synthase F1 sector epsilon subunit; AltName: Full=F-ATPase epsilon subunit [Paracoccus denitrificans PD1222]5DN6_I Chain I, ATP synthase epsilon chain [Paracoccus denitrificans]ABL71885.1 ATP synthase F1 subcomplex epsilon subunit [Paracoccus denitrificans PD1222]MBB4628002.1 F-type H+-transporting ATPase subunit epsilon [Paracoccus denitrificans]MCU7429071.1 F0F1